MLRQSQQSQHSCHVRGLESKKLLSTNFHIRLTISDFRLRGLANWIFSFILFIFCMSGRQILHESFLFLHLFSLKNIVDLPDSRLQVRTLMLRSPSTSSLDMSRMSLHCMKSGSGSTLTRRSCWR